MDGTAFRDGDTDGEAVHTNAMNSAGDIVTWFNRLIRWHPDVLREASEQYERQILHHIQTILGPCEPKAAGVEQPTKEYR